MERMVEAIREGEVIRVPEIQAIREDLFILRPAESIEARSNTEIARAMSKNDNVIDLTKKEKRGISRLDSWKREGRDYKKNNVVKDLIDNFNWEIAKLRRKRNISRKQLSEAIGVSEENLKIIENGGLPEDNFIIINRIESFFKVNLKKNPNAGREVNLAELQKKNEIKETARPSEESIKSIFGKDIEIID